MPKKLKLYLCGPGSVHPYSRHTLGIGFLQSNCANEEWEIEIVLKREELTDCDMIGLSCEASGAAEAVDILQSSSVPVILGGQISMWDKIVDYPFQHVVVGEGELALPEILSGTGERIIRRPHIEDLDTLKFPTRRFYNNKIYVISSRGCPYKCTFCAAQRYWGKPRWHSAEYLMDDIEQARKQYPQANLVHALDDLFVLNIKRFHRIHELWMERGYHKLFKLFNVSIRAKNFNREIAKTLAEMGIKQLRLGIESITPRIQKILGKQESVEDLEEVMSIAREIETPVLCYFMHHVPTETEEDLVENYKFIKRHKDIMIPVWVHFRYFPGCELYDGSSPLDEKMVVKTDPTTLQNLMQKLIDSETPVKLM